MEWNDNNLPEIIDYINSQLQLNRTMKDIEETDFGVSERVIRKRLARRNYKNINGKYQLIESAINPVKSSKPQTVIHNVPHKVDRQKTHCNTSNHKVLQPSNTINHSVPQVYQENLLKLAEDYDILKSIIEMYKQNQVLVDPKEKTLIIELPHEGEGKELNTSIRVNRVIWEQFNAFCDKHKMFTKKELISQAFKEMIEKYK